MRPTEEVMDNLSQEACSVCRADSPMVSTEESAELMQQLPEWQLVEHNGVNQLTRSFKFRNFAQALAFTNRVGAAAEQAKHHPALLTEWGSVRVTWWTHKIRGLHRNDFIMAVKTDQLHQTPL